MCIRDSFMDRVFYADLNGGGDRFRLKPAAVVISARRAGTTATWDQVNKYFGPVSYTHLDVYKRQGRRVYFPGNSSGHIYKISTVLQ